MSELSSQITLDEAELYRKIHISEFMDQNWDDENKGPGVSRLVSRYNKISHWVAFCILDVFDPKEQMKVYQKFVNLAHHLHEMQNYNSCTAILGGLSDASIARLKRISTVCDAPPCLHHLP